MKIGVMLRDALRRLLGRPLTIGYPLKPERPAAPSGYRGMIAYDWETCIGCMLCLKVCPSGAVSVADRRKVTFDVGRCIFCGQCAEVCPVGAVRLTSEFEMVAVDRSVYRVGPRW